MDKNNLVYYFNGVLFGVKTAIKLFAKLKDNKQAISLLCEAQKQIESGRFKSNTELWQYMEFEILKTKWSV